MKNSTAELKVWEADWDTLLLNQIAEASPKMQSTKSALTHKAIR